jgi:integrase/recombinase XerD
MTTRAARSDNSPLTERFIEHGRILRDWSPETVRSYRQSFRDCPAEITKATLNDAVVAMRERGLTPGGINVRLRSINSFLSWLHEEGHIREPLRVKLLKNPPKPIQTLSDQDVKRLVTYRPKGRIETRTWTLALVLLDCGLRISEALGLERANLDLDGLVLKVLGKGNKVRLVPISRELRKHLFRFLDKTEGRYVFQAFNGSHLERHNVYEELQRLCRRIGITAHPNPHNFRHAFAAHSMKNGLDVFRLSRILGHTNIATTQIYLRGLGIEHLQAGHAKHSPLGGGAR